MGMNIERNADWSLGELTWWVGKCPVSLSVSRKTDRQTDRRRNNARELDATVGKEKQ